MAARFSLFLFVYLMGTVCSVEFAPELIVWNVGQGQWVTIIDDAACWHFDMGGEFAPWKEILNRCRRRPNRISLSHWDSDHISFATKASRELPELCLFNRPVGRASARKEALIEALPPCPFSSPFEQWADPAGKSANDKSWVVQSRRVLMPGDSTRHEERHWIHQLPHLNQIHFLVLGHHGSRTSTSPALLAAMPQLKITISSARFRRYGHPHQEVVRELVQTHTPLLRTEEWGTIHILL